MLKVCNGALICWVFYITHPDVVGEVRCQAVIASTLNQDFIVSTVQKLAIRYEIQRVLKLTSCKQICIG